jgi:ribosome maturation protein Sdo1
MKKIFNHLSRRTMPRQTTKKFGRERIYNAMDFFENESFLNATLNRFVAIKINGK